MLAAAGASLAWHSGDDSVVIGLELSRQMKKSPRRIVWHPADRFAIRSDPSKAGRGLRPLSALCGKRE
jgi:hypothetical protein